MKVILASESPRRREILKYIVEDFEVIPALIDENVLPDDIEVFDVAEYLAVKKAAFVSKQHSEALVIACDTTVITGGNILGKPGDTAEAVKMLKTLSGKTHKVITGVCLFKGKKSMSFCETTEVTFYDLSDKEIEDYVKTGDPMDKAGGYGIQEIGAFLVRAIKGDFYNVMGLPVAKLKRELDCFLAQNPS